MAKYGFYDRLSSEFPSQVIVDIAEICNLRCIHCPHPQFKESEHYSARLLDPELNKKLIDDIRDNSDGHCQYIRYTSNGEPLMHPHAHEMIQYAVEHSGTFVTLTTNGTVLNEKKLKQLLESGLHMIDVSIDAFKDETYANIRGGRLEQVRRNIIRMIEHIKTGQYRTRIVVSFIRQAGNEDEVDDFSLFWKNQGADEVLIRNLHSAAGMLAQGEAHSHESRRPCLYPWERLTLDPKGELSFCPTDWAYASSFIDYRKTTLKTAWQGAFLNELREAHLNNDFKCHTFCGQCPDWRLTTWPDSGRSYANLVSDIKVIMK
ncbi:radical SAM/SPASM domain-containing protein [Aeromonas sp. 601027]|uniref:radical SAM/SPASM domain-containing protein n=1 Tax=unclassified Aeromonas TaxID=257493 RepID=UPI003BA1DFBA